MTPYPYHIIFTTIWRGGPNYGLTALVWQPSNVKKKRGGVGCQWVKKTYWLDGVNFSLDVQGAIGGKIECEEKLEVFWADMEG